MICKEETCTMPAYREGIYESACFGHQPLYLPEFIQHEGDVYEVKDEATNCWECGQEPPASMAFVDTPSFAGELWCALCIAQTLMEVTVRRDIEGDNY